MRPLAWFAPQETPDAAVPVGHGEFIGRLASAALRIDDGRISEAHAMVSLRGRKLHLLGLRGRFRVRSKVCADVVLEEGLAIEFASGVTWVCTAIEMPTSVLALQFGDGPPIVPTGTTSVFAGPPVRISPDFVADADAIIWSLADEWRARLPDGSTRPLTPGDTLELPGGRVDVVELPLERAVAPATRQTLRAPVALHLRDDGVGIVVGDTDEVFVGGTPGRLIRALAAADGRASWQDVAAAVWVGDRSDPSSLRRRFDTTVTRARERLSALGLSGAMIALDHQGGVVLRLSPHDRVVE